MHRKGSMPETLYNMKQLAQFCGKSYDTLRIYYTFDGLLPDPAYTIRHKNKTTRKFTLKEMKKIKKILDNIQWGDIAEHTRKRRYPKKGEDVDES